MPVVKLSYEERILNEVLNNREFRQKRGEHFMVYDQRCFKALRAILQPLYDGLDAERDHATEAEAERDRALSALKGALSVIADFVPEGTKPHRRGWIAEWEELVRSITQPAIEPDNFEAERDRLRASIREIERIAATGWDYLPNVNVKRGLILETARHALIPPAIEPALCANCGHDHINGYTQEFESHCLDLDYDDGAPDKACKCDSFESISEDGE